MSAFRDEFRAVVEAVAVSTLYVGTIAGMMLHVGRIAGYFG